MGRGWGTVVAAVFFAVVPAPLLFRFHEFVFAALCCVILGAVVVWRTCVARVKLVDSSPFFASLEGSLAPLISKQRSSLLKPTGTVSRTPESNSLAVISQAKMMSVQELNTHTRTHAPRRPKGW